MSEEYKKNKITVYRDFSHAAEDEAKYIANQSPIDRIRETVQLILRVYSMNEKTPNTNKIYIDKE